MAAVALTGVMTGSAWLAPAVAAAPAPVTPAGAPTSGSSAPTGPAGRAPAAAETRCAISGYAPDTEDRASELRGTLRKQSASDLGGTRLDRADTWVVPADSHPVLVVDSTEQLTEGSARVFLFGLDFALKSGAGQARERYVSTTRMPHLGSTVRVVGIRAESNACGGSLVLVADRSVFGTRLGQAGLAAGGLFGVLLVVVARRRGGSWLRRFLLAAPLGLVAGAGEAALLQESGLISPFSRVTWAVPVAGVLLAALLPLTRRRRPAPPEPSPGGVPWLAPVHVPLGAYRAVASFTRTAVAQVDRGTHRDSGERVLLKVLLPERSGDREAAARLAREADVLARLDDPHCLRFKETLTGADGALVLVTEYVDGVTARQLLAERGPLTGPQACTVLAGALAGLSAVHDAGLVHRDVRPENIYLDADGRVLLAGFEVAAPGGDNAETAEGVPPYAGPQQRRGEPVDGRADLWSAGAVLAELLTGSVPVVADDTAQVLLPAGGGELPEPIADLIGRAMASDPATRPQTAAQMHAALREAAAQAYGPDWTSLGALTGAVVLPGGIVAASTVAGAGGAVGLAVAGTATGTAGFGAAAPVTVAQAGAGGVGTAQAAATVSGVAGAASTPAAKVAVLVTPVLAVAAAAVVGLSGAAGAAPSASAEVITPEAARVIFVRTVAEARNDSLVHIAEPIRDRVSARFGVIFPDAGRQLADIVVGVPRDQRGYPAYFVATAHVVTPEATVYLLTRFDRSSADRPWLMTSLRAWFNRVVAAPKLDPDGYLAPAPPVRDLIADPGRLPTLYLDWLRRSEVANAVVTDPLLTPAGGTSFVHQTALTENFMDRRNRVTSFRYGPMTPGPVGLDLVPFADGTVLATFDVTMHEAYFNMSRQSTAACTRNHLFLREVRPGERFRRLDIDWKPQVQAWIPVRAAATTSPGASPPTPTPTASGAPLPVPVAADRVTIDDSVWLLELTAAVPC